MAEALHAQQDEGASSAWNTTETRPNADERRPRTASDWGPRVPRPAVRAGYARSYGLGRGRGRGRGGVATGPLLLRRAAEARGHHQSLSLSFTHTHNISLFLVALSSLSFPLSLSSLSFFSPSLPGEDSFSLRLLLAAADAGGGGVLERESFDGLTYRATGSTLLLAIKVRSSQPRVVAYRLSPFLTARMSRRDACCSRSSTTTPGRGPRSPVRRARGA